MNTQKNLKENLDKHFAAWTGEPEHLVSTNSNIAIECFKEWLIAKRQELHEHNTPLDYKMECERMDFIDELLNELPNIRVCPSEENNVKPEIISTNDLIKGPA